MRRIFIAVIAGALLLVSGIAASAKLDSSSGKKGQQVQQTQMRSSKETSVKTLVPVENAMTAATAAKPAPAKSEPATTSTNPPATTQGQCGFQGEQTGEHQDAACNDQKVQAGVNESKTDANDKADLPEKDSGQQGNDQQGNSQD